MSQTFSPNNLNHVLDGLKDFQRQTVEYVFQRLYTAEDSTRRFLIADEVGLGKTLVARGVIARALDYLQDKVDRLDVVYICSNADIARQNINRLNITGQSEFALASRITLLPIQMHKLNKRLNFISFTPNTSFDLKSGMGMAEERVLLYKLLQQAWGIDSTAALNVMQGYMGAGRFRDWVRNFSKDRIEPTLAEKFVTELASHPNLRTRFDELCDIYKRADSNIPAEASGKRSAWLGETRALLARSCLTALEPDLIILDEFQRFKHLLNNESEDSELARHLFNYSTDHMAARVILLSATPYKMYTQADEESDDHYQDFVQTLKFLFNDSAQIEQVERLIREYRQEILNLHDDDATNLRAIKADLEQHLRRVMVRTERLAASADRDGMLVHIPSDSMELKSDDLSTYVGLAKVSEILEQPSSLEYWKSVPYLFNFMDEYQLKANFELAFDTPDQINSMIETLNKHPQLLLSIKDIEDYAKLDPGNARLRSLLADTVEKGTWRALWLPPSFPYYALEEPFANQFLARFTKRLVFSAWRVVPKAISIFLSYESERLIFHGYDKTAKNTTEARERRRPLLRFAKNSDGRLTGLPVLGLIYPCQTLAQSLDPLQLGAELYNKELPSLEKVTAYANKQVLALLSTLPIKAVNTGVEDERWYWAAPLLLDAYTMPEFTKEWWQLEKESNLAMEWAGYTDDQQGNNSSSEEGDTQWDKHVQEAQNLLRDFFSGNLQLGRAPADLSQVLAQMAIAGFGTVSLRALLRITRYSIDSSDMISVSVNAAKIAKSFLYLFNLPESIALIRSLNSAEPYWRRTLEYCAAGGLQSVLDEYMHILQESLGLKSATPTGAVEALSERVCEVLTYRTSTPNMDNIQPNSATPITSYGMRGRFALRFGDEKNADGSEPTRADRVRSAFNSPFWPFVLATTSIGQEGLDFHNYCHAIVHWNLPTNPVDMEQREGRVHRYKGHAVRKNLANSYTLPNVVSFMKAETDVWETLFGLARANRTEDQNDLHPFWLYPMEGGAKIERHVPALPLSQDQYNLAALQRSLAIYRMVFGQNRQEDLLTYLVDHFSPEKLKVLMSELLIDLSPPQI